MINNTIHMKKDYLNMVKLRCLDKEFLIVMYNYIFVFCKSKFSFSFYLETSFFLNF